MNEQDITTTAADVELDIDDVEAHGIKEVMVGLSAAAVLTGGVAAVVSSGGDSAGASATKARISAPQASDAVEADASVDLGGTDAASVGAGNTALGGLSAPGGSSVSIRPATSVDGTEIDGSTAGRASLMDRADQTVDSTVSDVRSIRDSALDTARSTVRNAPQTVDDAVDNARSTATNTVNDARATVRNAPGTVRTTVNNAQDTVDRVADSAVNDVDRTLDATIAFAGDTVRGVQGTVSNLTGRIMPSVGTNLDARTLTGTVTVSIGGEQVAQADVKNGQFSVSYTAPQADVPISVHYTGPAGSLAQLL